MTTMVALVLLGVLLAVPVLAQPKGGAAPAENAAPAAGQSLTWTAGPTSSGWYTISGGLAELLREKAGLNIRVVPGGGTQNPVLVEKAEADIGMGLPPLLQAAQTGEDPYKGINMSTLRAIAGNMSLNAFHFYVAADSPFASMTMEQIFHGKKPIRLAISRPGTFDVWVFEKVMEFYDIGYEDWGAAGARFFRGSYSEQAGAFKDRSVDGAFTLLTLPDAAVTEASAGRSLKLLPFPEPLLAHLAKFGVGHGTIPAGTYPKAANGNQTIPSATMRTTITASTRMSDEVAYTMAKTLGDNADAVRKIHGSLAGFDPSKAALDLGVPLHPGAERYYGEHGYLK